MKAMVLVKTGSAHSAFELREVGKPSPRPNEVLIQTEGFGLNFADIMARTGLYPDAPPLPSILGYEVVGKIVEKGSDVSSNLNIGDRVTALTRFGGYAEFAVANSFACVKIEPSTPLAEAAALATQYCTAYYAACVKTQIHSTHRVLIHAAAGGVGLALVQLAKLKGAEIIATVGSDSKIDLVKSQGASLVINYQKEDFKKVIEEAFGKESLDLVFDSLGGQTFKKGYSLLRPTGAIVGFGSAEAAGSGNQLWKGLKLVAGFGFFTPIQLLMQSRAMIGVNMLRVADHRPEIFKDVFESVAELYRNGKIKPISGGEFPVNKLADAHELLESRKSVGKIVVRWN